LRSRADACCTARSRRGRRVACALGASVALALAAPLRAAPADASASGAATPSPRLDVARVEAAASAVRADPDLGGTRKESTWRLRDRGQPDAAPPPPWLAALARWLAESGRVLVWVLGAIALAVVVVTARRWLAVHGDAIGARKVGLPSHVRELDIRPESLPADIGAAVRELWLAGDRRAALSLLYRGALSRLVHSYEVAIGDASTEGDCVRLARAALPPARGDFVGALVDAWQLAVYGGRTLPTEHVLRLCADFDRLLPALAAAAPDRSGRP
jgi:hypothetical protein